MRKVVLRWKNISLRGAKEISEILNICERLEILGHLAISEKSVTQLAEIKLKEGQTLENFSELENFQIIEVHEENDDGILVSLLCTHPLAISAIELSNIHIHPPYGISEEKGMELRISGLSKSVSRFIRLIRMVLPPEYLRSNISERR